MEVSLKTAATGRIRAPQVEGKHPPLPALVCVCVCVCPWWCSVDACKMNLECGDVRWLHFRVLVHRMMAAGCDEPLQQIVNFSVYCGVLSLGGGGGGTGLC